MDLTIALAIVALVGAVSTLFFAVKYHQLREELDQVEEQLSFAQLQLQTLSSAPKRVRSQARGLGLIAGVQR